MSMFGVVYMVLYHISPVNPFRVLALLSDFDSVDRGKCLQ